MTQDEMLIRVNQVMGKDYTHKSWLITIGDLVDRVERQQQEFAFLNESIAETDTLIELLQKESEQLREEINHFKLQEILLLERLKKADSEIRNLKNNTKFEVYEENLSLIAENARLRELAYGK
ncbi:hypothetical protein HPT25_23625 [Bacillus sp. BRMEA1]|uniref:hypothetical protein n=1 Tax=Neobacillus endophyticus TaxID=2738405 RepID=UPI001564E919|nr:hypothetical protein [Neobacillus endophyticus]NRD80316.1 hypothetical protein [Neobacillus endophyticus]